MRYRGASRRRPALFPCFRPRDIASIEAAAVATSRRYVRSPHEAQLAAAEPARHRTEEQWGAALEDRPNRHSAGFTAPPQTGQDDGVRAPPRVSTFIFSCVVLSPQSGEPRTGRWRVPAESWAHSALRMDLSNCAAEACTGHSSFRVIGCRHGPTSISFSDPAPPALCLPRPRLSLPPAVSVTPSWARTSLTCCAWSIPTSTARYVWYSQSPPRKRNEPPAPR